MSSIKVVDVNNEEAKEEVIQEEIEEAKEETKEEVNEIVNEEEKEEETTKPQIEENKPEKLKNNSKSERLKDKNITCPKCNKTMLLRSYRYKHELNCQGKLEERAIKPKSKPKPKAQPIVKEVLEEEVEEVEEIQQHEALPVGNQKPKLKLAQEVKNQILKPQSPNLVDFASHYQLLQNQFIQQKKEKYNNLCQNMFAPKSKKR